MIRPTLFYAGVVLSLLFFGTVVFPSGMFLPFRTRYRLYTGWARFVVWWCEVVCGIHYRIEGEEHLAGGPAIVCSKHQSAWETFAYPALLPMQCWVLKKELMRVPLFGWGMWLLDAIAVDRNAGRKALNQLVAEGTRRLDSGQWVIIFPEGTRVPPGEKGRYNIGGAMLASRSGYPILPVAHNAGEFWPPRTFGKHPGTVTISIGPRIRPEGKSASELNREVESWIEGRTSEISSRPDEHPAGVSISRDLPL